jgi:predicted outer membrane repeat protein
MLATNYIVNSLADTADPAPDGELTFREALIAANSDRAFGDAPAGSGLDTITLDSSLTGERIRPESSATSTPFSITQPVHISDFDFQGFDGTFHIRTRSAVTFENITVRGGAGVDSSAIVVANGILRVFDSLFLSNIAQNTSGGAIHMSSSGTLWIKNTEFNGNRAFGSESARQGGAIFQADGNLVIDDSTFFRNSSDGDGGAISANASSINLKISNSEFRENFSSQSGGAVSVRSPDASAQISIARSTLYENMATSNGGSVSLKSAMLESSDNNYRAHRFRNSEFRAQNGGAIYADSGSALTLRRDQFERFRVGRNGGAVYSDAALLESIDSQYTENYATGNGGAIFSTGDVIVRSTNQSDRLEEGPGIKYQNQGTFEFAFNESTVGSGGAIFVTTANLEMFGQNVFFNNSAEKNGAAIRVEDGNLNFNGGFFLTNRVRNGGGGAISFHGSEGSIRSTLFDFNIANGESVGGAIYAKDSRIRIAASEFVTSRTFSYGAHGYLLDSELRIDDSVVHQGFAASLSDPDSPGEISDGAGGFYVAGTSMLRIRSTLFRHNTASKYGVGGTIFIEPTASSDIRDSQFFEGVALSGGAIFNQGSLYVSNTSFEGNRAFDWDQPEYTRVSQGGSIVNEGTATIVNATFTSHEREVFSWPALANGGGGAITNRGDLYVTDTDFLSAQAASSVEPEVGVIESGGALNIESGNVVLRGVNFRSNSSIRGGAIGIQSGSLYGINVVFSDSKEAGNQSAPHIDQNFSREDYSGSALFAEGSSDVTLRNATFFGNRSAGGGAVALSANEQGIPSVRILGESQFIQNFSGYREGVPQKELYDLVAPRGAAIHNVGGIVDARDVVFANNIANAEGGAIFNSSNEFGIGSLTLRRTQFSRNRSLTSGAAIFNDAELLVTDSVFNRNSAPDTTIASSIDGTTTLVRTQVDE